MHGCEHRVCVFNQGAVNRTNTESDLPSGTAAPRLKMPPCGRNAHFGPFQQKSSKPVS